MFVFVLVVLVIVVVFVVFVLVVVVAMFGVLVVVFVVFVVIVVVTFIFVVATKSHCNFAQDFQYHPLSLFSKQATDAAKSVPSVHSALQECRPFLSLEVENDYFLFE